LNDPPAINRPRTIRSFVRREGRITAAQRRALGALSARYCIETNNRLDLDAVFGRHAPHHMEIGCGSGETLSSLAAQHPENDYLGIEVYRPGLGTLLQRLAEAQLENVRLIPRDAAIAIGSQIEEESLEGIYLFFPDPWRKKRHHKRRLIQPHFASLLRDKLKPQGRLFIATDWEDYAQHILRVMEAAGFINLAGEGAFAPRPRWRPLTRYERRSQALGHSVRELVYAKK
jgi:tRNA (guanine-N7-)-methyltransferase